ncbi:hypothetical protein ACFWWC_43370 [Streptomyces sp. NPDC058642]|uniref:hypothetical protein n=1 Tax=Streptomyces sp. NPDC058642 TaxID=3346572 RepID=UPI00364A9467
MSAALIEALGLSGTLVFVVVIVRLLFPGGVPGMMHAWSHFRTTSDARKLVTTPEADKRQIGVDMLRVLYGAGGGPETQAAPASPGQPPDSPAEPPP